MVWSQEELAVEDSRVEAVCVEVGEQRFYSGPE